MIPPATDVDDDDVIDETDDAVAERHGATSHELALPANARGRLDAVLALQLPLSRSRLTALIEGGQVSVDGAVVVRPALRLRGGERVIVNEPPPQPTTLVPEELPLALVYDDDDCCVVDKAAGAVVHPGAGHASGTIANALLWRFPHLEVGGERRPGIVHRLDKDTSGLLVVAKHDAALRALQTQFAARTVDKRYVAVCVGLPGEIGATVDVVTGHARHPKDRRRFTTKLAADAAGARRAHSTFTVRAVRDGVAVVDVALHTGRTHQIRAQLADRGHPLVHDALYGGVDVDRRVPPGRVRDAARALTRHALHAAALTFAQPTTGAPVVLTSSPPPDLTGLIAAITAQAT